MLMKNAINYYYGLESQDIHQSQKNYFFSTQNEKYILYECNLSIEEVNKIYELSTLLSYYKIPYHQILMNKQNKIFTSINNTNYVLMKIKCDINEINSFSILNNNTLNLKNTNNIKYNNWYNLWTKKIDFLEYQFLEHKGYLKENKYLFNYYIGMTETAIMLSKKIKDGTKSICHKRINYKDTTLELYNPLNIIIDYKVRDACEYFKNKFIYDELSIQEVINYINTLNIDDIYIFFTRLLFPSYFFDIYENIIEKKENEKRCEKIINKVEEYESFLKIIYSYVKNITNIEEIEWLTKNVG